VYQQRICKKLVGNRRLLLVHSSDDGFGFGTTSPAVDIDGRVFLIAGLPVPMILRRVVGQRE
jgi:hypothetical protein